MWATVADIVTTSPPSTDWLVFTDTSGGERAATTADSLSSSVSDCIRLWEDCQTSVALTVTSSCLNAVGDIQLTMRLRTQSTLLLFVPEFTSCPKLSMTVPFAVIMVRQPFPEQMVGETLLVD